MKQKMHYYTFPIYLDVPQSHQVHQECFQPWCPNPCILRGYNYQRILRGCNCQYILQGCNFQHILRGCILLHILRGCKFQQLLGYKPRHSFRGCKSKYILHKCNPHQGYLRGRLLLYKRPSCMLQRQLFDMEEKHILIIVIRLILERMTDFVQDCPTVITCAQT